MSLVIPHYTKRQARAAVQRFNADHAVGAPVLLLRDTGEQMATTTRSRAEIAASGAPVVWLTGVAGFYHLHRVAPTPPAANAATKETT